VAELDFDDRQKAQNRVITTSGEAVGLFIERGSSLKDGDRLSSNDGTVLRIAAKAERLSLVRASDLSELTRAAYHLGNRHVRLELGPNFLAYQADYVLDDLVRQLGFEVTEVVRPFEPAPGAYHRHGHAHEPAHEHEHEHEHEHGHAHGHSHGHAHGYDPTDRPLIFKAPP